MPVLDLDMSELHRIFDINVFGTIRVIKAMSDLLIESKGTIVNVGSLAAYSPYAFGGLRIHSSLEEYNVLILSKFRRV